MLAVGDLRGSKLRINVDKMMPGTLRTLRKKKARSYIPSKYVSHDIPVSKHYIGLLMYVRLWPLICYMYTNNNNNNNNNDRNGCYFT